MLNYLYPFSSEDACQSTKEFALTECEDCDAEKTREIERLEKECESPDGTVSCSRIVLHHNSDLSDCISQIITVDRKKCVSKTDGNKKPSESATVNYHGDLKNQNQVVPLKPFFLLCCCCYNQSIYASLR